MTQALYAHMNNKIKKIQTKGRAEGVVVHVVDCFLAWHAVKALSSVLSTIGGKKRHSCISSRLLIC
jgi:hypothetical protein